MKSHEIDLLRSQLAEALTEPPFDGGLERAALAGLLARLSPDDPLIEQVEEGLDDPVIPAIAEAGARALALVDAVDEDDDPALAWNALCAVDEACAASWLVARPALVEQSVQDAIATVRAFPAPFAPHAEAASTVLQERPPRAGDPAWGLWAAVELSGVGLPLDEDGASWETRIALDLDVVVPLFGRGGPREGARLAADSDELPAPASWIPLCTGPDWELARTEDLHGEPVLLLSGAEPSHLSCDGEPRTWTETVEGRSCPATAGAWEIRVGDRTIRFRIEA